MQVSRDDILLYRSEAEADHLFDWNTTEDAGCYVRDVKPKLTKEMLKILPSLFVADTENKGRGVFTLEKIPPRKVVEISSVLVMDHHARVLLDQTTLHDYIFDWGATDGFCCVAWGYVSLYNHSYQSNCEYFMDYETRIITIKSVRTIQPGEELTINYNGDWDNRQQVWFESV